MIVSEFIKKWKDVDLDNWKERATFQTYFNDLCNLVGHDPPVLADPDGKTFKYERFVIKPTGKRGFADVAYRGHFAWEQKGKGEDLDEAFAQLLSYIRDLGNPPLLVTGDFERIIIHTNFNNTQYAKYEVTLEEMSEKLHLVSYLFHEPEKLRPPIAESELGKKSRHLSIAYEQVQPVRVESGFGRYGHPGGPLPAIMGETKYRIVMINPSYITARLITVDLRIEADFCNCPEMLRQLDLEGRWHIEGCDEQYYTFPRHYRFQSSQDTYCLPDNDEITLGYLKFLVQTRDKSRIVDELILETEKDLEIAETDAESEFITFESAFDPNTKGGKVYLLEWRLQALKGKGLGSQMLSLTGYSSIQHDLLDLYHRNPAKDIYRLHHRVRAEGFSMHEDTTEIEINWRN